MQLADLLDHPDRLSQVAGLLDLEPAALHADLARELAHQPMANPALYQAQGVEKAARLVGALEQCRELAEDFEARFNSPSHLSHTLAHVRAQLVLLVAGYELPE